LTAVGNLAALLWQSGEREEAYALQDEVAASLSRSRPADDPAVQRAQAVLDLMLREAFS
jgi:hypothetical protein